MKKLSEKFDHLPQDFDREIIWQGIKKPKPALIFHTYFRVACLFIALVVLFFIFTPGDSPVLKPEKDGASEKAIPVAI